MKTILKIKNLSKTFLQNEKEHVIINNFSLDFNRGEIVVLLGPTGCGKTTLLRLISGLEKCSSGGILLNGKDISQPTSEVGMVFQNGTLFPWLTVAKNIEFSLKIKKLHKKERKKRVDELLELVRLKGANNFYPHTLSGGMKMRTALARALAHDGELLLMDEPFASLDERTRSEMQIELLNIWEKKNKTIIFVTHNIDEAIKLGSRVIVMSDEKGKIELDIKIEQLRPRDPNSKEFLKAHLLLRESFEKIISRKLDSSVV